MRQTRLTFADEAEPEGNGERGSPAAAAHQPPGKRAAPSTAAQVPDGRSELQGAVRACFASLVVGSSNRLAHAAVLQVQARLGVVSPLVLHGPSGCGKTHLLEALRGAVRRQFQQRRAILLSAEQFTSNFLEALQGAGLPSFRRRYREVDLLLIDDVQFFTGKKATLVEFQHTLDTMSRAGKQVVLAADRAPAELVGLGPELQNRLSGGLVCGIDAPDDAMRFQMLKNFAAQLALPVDEEVLRVLAAQLPADARQLRGALHRIAAVSAAFEQPVTLEMAMEAVADLIKVSRRNVLLPDIERAVCQVFGVEASQLHAERRTKDISMPRMLAMWLARKYTRAALTEIGEFFGRKSHSTVIAAQQNVERWRSGKAFVRLANGECAVEDAIRRVELELRLA